MNIPRISTARLPTARAVTGAASAPIQRSSPFTRVPLLVAAGLLLAVTGCRGSEEDSGDSDLLDTADTGSPNGQDTGETGDPSDTADTGDTGDSGETCDVTIKETDPEDGESDWYYRDPVEVTFSEAASTWAEVGLLDAEGAEVPATLTWNEEETRVELLPDPTFEPARTYTLWAEVCEDATEVVFETADYGTGLEMDAGDLVDNTYVVDWNQVEFTEPPYLGTFISGYLDPLLVGVVEVSDDTITLVAALGKETVAGGYKQLDPYSWWLFEESDFSESPFFSADVSAIDFEYDDEEIPVEDFHLEATFAADGSSLGGGKLSGFIDTRPVSRLIGYDEDWACEQVAMLGIECEACPSDQEPYCLDVMAENIEAPLEEGLVIEMATEDTGDSR